uniref:hypothetical protein n=1 Tax=uncultured Acinetobacter sp. TaxID=165433 RepID=UPI00262E4021|nr:hypothetical protein [uncultured Acinetobacter sp.]
MDIIDEFKAFIPAYLSDETRKSLEDGLKAFLSDDDLATRKLEYFTSGSNFLMQGDCVKNIFMFDYNRQMLKENARVAILSNTCDIDPANLRDIPIDCVVAPILNLDSIESMLLNNGISKNRVKQKIDNFKRNIVTNAFYLPLEGSEHGFAVFFDKAFSLPVKFINIESRIKSLSQIGFYLFIYSLSINFCRIHEKVDRNTL